MSSWLSHFHITTKSKKYNKKYVNETLVKSKVSPQFNNYSTTNNLWWLDNVSANKTFSCNTFHFLWLPAGGALLLADQVSTVGRCVALTHCLLSMRPLYE